MPNTTDRPPLRSWLFTPATRPDRFAKAAAVGADVLILDLEDAVAPPDKPEARTNALAFLAQAGKGAPTGAVRINGLGTRAGLDDLHALLASPADPGFIVLPKTEAASHLVLVDALLAEAGKSSRLIALIEGAAALAKLDEIATATPRLAALMFGAADMAADLGAAVDWEPLLNARSSLVAAAALSGVLAIDTPFFDVHDTAGLGRELGRSLALGFAAKAAIHPAQVAPINAALTPSRDAVDRARRILAENAKGVGVVDGRMIDEAVARQARRTLAAAGVVAVETI